MYMKQAFSSLSESTDETFHFPTDSPMYLDTHPAPAPSSPTSPQQKRRPGAGGRRVMAMAMGGSDNPMGELAPKEKNLDEMREKVRTPPLRNFHQISPFLVASLFKEFSIKTRSKVHRK